MKINEVQINFIKPKNGIIAFASFVLNDSFYMGSIAIHKKLNGDGFRVTYPTKPLGQDNINVFHPINRDVALKIETKVIQKLKDVMKTNKNDRHCSINNSRR